MTLDANGNPIPDDSGTTPPPPGPRTPTQADIDAAAAAARREGEAKGRADAKREADETAQAARDRAQSDKNKQEGKWQEELTKAEGDRDDAIQRAEAAERKLEQYETWLDEDFTSALETMPDDLKELAPDPDADGIAKRKFVVKAKNYLAKRTAPAPTPDPPRQPRSSAARTPAPAAKNDDADDQALVDDLFKGRGGRRYG